MLFGEENFEEDLISEKVAVASIPYLHTTREKSHDSSYYSSNVLTQRDMGINSANLNKLLYGNDVKKRITNSANHRQRNELL
jgi:NADH:ubiquinone oxidoreductase subunit D